MSTKKSIVLLCSLMACEGAILEGEGSEEVSIPPIEARSADDCEGVDPTVPYVDLRRLTRVQYGAALRDLFETDAAEALRLPHDASPSGFSVAGVPVALTVDMLQTLAEEVAESAPMSAYVTCDLEELMCVEATIRGLAGRAYRRPLSEDEYERLRALFEMGSSEERGFGTLHGGMRLVVEAILQSPNFLYHIEADALAAEDGAVVALRGYELANRLSFFLWASLPDDELTRAAESGELNTLEGLRAQAERMLEDEKSVYGFRSFFRTWLQVDEVALVEKNEDYYAFSPELAQDLETSLERSLDDALITGELAALFESQTYYVNARIAHLFGLDPEDFGDEFVPVQAPPGQRSGIVTHPALLALHSTTTRSDPIHRAIFIREQLLCQHLLPPPPGLNIVAPDPEPGLSTRELFAQHSEDPACAQCHIRLDPLGFGFEDFDGVGRFRDSENGIPVDASGEMFAAGSLDGPFEGGAQLASRMAEAQEVRECVARQLFRFALQRTEQQADECSLQVIFAASEASEFRLQALMLAIVESDAFRFQKVVR